MALTTAQRNSLLAQVDAHAALIMGLPVEAPAPAPAPTPAPPPAPSPTPSPAPGSRQSLYFSPTGSNSNAGTQASPKRDLSGLNLDSLPPTTLYFQRDGVWQINQTKRLSNTNLDANGECLVFDSYGTGAKPELQFNITTGTPAFEWGNWQDQRTFTGYRFRNLKLNGMGVVAWGLWLRGFMDDLVIDKCEITGFQIGIHATAEFGAKGARVTNNRIVRNSDMGVLGHWNNTVIENNYIAENNFSGSGFSHGTYLSGSRNVAVRNNHYYKNSTVNGVCTGGNCTFHGQFEGLLVEGNLIEQEHSAEGGWQMSITSGYTTAEWFHDLVARRNWFINSGNVAMNVQNAPGAVIEDNVIQNNQGSWQVPVSVGMEWTEGGDEPTTGAVSRNNRAYLTNGSTGDFVMVPSAGTQSNNQVIQGLPTEQYVGFNPALLD